MFCLAAIFFFNDSATTEFYTYLHTLSLHDALSISAFGASHRSAWRGRRAAGGLAARPAAGHLLQRGSGDDHRPGGKERDFDRGVRARTGGGGQGTDGGDSPGRSVASEIGRASCRERVCQYV